MPNIAKEHGSEIPEGYQTLTGSERRPMPGAKLLRPADPKESFSVTIVLRRRPDGPPIPESDELLAARKQPRMSQDEFATKYGAAPEDVERVTQFVKAHRMTVVETHLARRTVSVSGTVAQMSKAFAVELGTYEYPAPPRHGEATYRGRDGLIAVPKELAHIILAVFGLDNRAVSQHAGSGDPFSTSPLTVKKATELYNFPDSGPAIAGQTIGVISPGGSWGGYLQSDLDSYFNKVGEKKIKPIDISVDGAFNGALKAVTTASSKAGDKALTFGPRAIPKRFPGKSFAFTPAFTPPGSTQAVSIGVKDVTRSRTSTTVTLKAKFPNPIAKGTTIYFNVGPETTQDICVAASAAPGAHIVVYFAPETEQGWIDVFLRAIWPDKKDFRDGVNPPSVLSCSFSLTQGDDQRGKGFITFFSIVMLDSFFLLDAVVRGVTICAATGDSGSQGSPKLADGHAHVWYPASDPFVLAVGGTTLGKTQSGEWVEYVWNDASGATGGGVSDVFGVPSYQSHLGVPKSVNPSPPFMARGRGIPDVAANASLASGYPMFFCGAPYTAAGTSAATPLWAGLIARINSYRPNPFGNIGWVNWQLYYFAASWKNLFNPLNALFRDPHHPNLAACPTNNGYGGVKGYPAKSGWDACTGLGSPNGKALLEMFVFAD